MQGLTAEDMLAVLRPIESLLHKSEKALEKLAEGTWQHAMLRDNVRAMRLSCTLLTGGVGAAEAFDRAELAHAQGALFDMLRRSEQAQRKFAEGTAQFTLQRNRIHALCVAESLVAEAVEAKS